MEKGFLGLLVDAVVDVAAEVFAAKSEKVAVDSESTTKEPLQKKAEIQPLITSPEQGEPTKTTEERRSEIDGWKLFGDGKLEKEFLAKDVSEILVSADISDVVVNTVKGTTIQAQLETNLELLSLHKAGNFKIKDTFTHKKLAIDVKFPDLRRFNVRSKLVLYIPEETLVVLQVASLSGNAEARGKYKKIKLESKSGNVSYDGNTEHCQVETASGNAEVNGAAHESVVKSMSGNVYVHGSFKTLNATSMSGNVKIISTNANGVVEVATSMSGNVNVTGPVILKHASSLSGTVTKIDTRSS